MAYVRRRGHQIAIVTGGRNPETRKVEQRVLFTLYSKPEALEVLGRGGDARASGRFESLMKRQHPDITFDWKALRNAIAADIDHLPASYEYKEARLTGRFRNDLIGFTRSLLLADPQDLLSAGALIRENRAALECLSELIAWRLQTCVERKANEWNADNPFFWRFASQGKDVPPAVEEHAAGFWERRDLVHAEAAFQLLIEAFPDYAEGHNYLGLIASEREDFAAAEGHFWKTIEVGRRLLPKRVAKSAWWTDLDTRPYMRGLRNLGRTLIRAARYEDAMAIADRLEQECADDLTATSHRAAIALNTGDWKLAAESALRLRGLWPQEGLLEALARVEMGEHALALEAFLHGAFNQPTAARIVLGFPSRAPKTYTEIEDHNTGVHFLQVLGGYLGKTTRGAAFLRQVASDKRVARWMHRVEELRGQWFGHPKADRAIFDELTRLTKRDFAAGEARLLEDLVPSASGTRGSGTAGTETANRRRSVRRSSVDLH
jgi:tetratricopeptide (TPR) repeat protein